VERLDEKVLTNYIKQFFIPQRMVVCGVGVDHAELVQLAKEHFTGPRGTDPKVETPKYTGGEVRINVPDSPTTHVSLAFETASWKSPDVFAMCVLQILMGGGGAFSAGGPGKGMCSRLYTNILNQYDWVENAMCFDSIFSDSAIFGINAISLKEQAKEVVDVVCMELEGMTKVEAPELDRAKAQLKMGLLIQLESRAMQFEDMGRQLLTYNRVQSAEELCKSVDRVSAADVQRVAASMLKKKPSLAVYGNLHYMPRYEDIAARFGGR
jgi:processing peptidase subunit alpha